MSLHRDGFFAQGIHFIHIVLGIMWVPRGALEGISWVKHSYNSAAMTGLRLTRVS
jgi:hypothetical protein